MEMEICWNNLTSLSSLEMKVVSVRRRVVKPTQSVVSVLKTVVMTQRALMRAAVDGVPQGDVAGAKILWEADCCRMGMNGGSCL